MLPVKSYAVRIVSDEHNNIVLNISGLAKGMYIVKIKMGLLLIR